MMSGIRLPRRKPLDWAGRLVLATAAAGLGYVSVAHALALSLRSASPAYAYAMAPWDGRIVAAYARMLAGPEAKAESRAKSDRLARVALRRDPTALPAVTTIGINAELRGQAGTARRALNYSTALSRRDLITHLWGIEVAVAQNDIPGALFHYDSALRTSRSASEILFPVLTTALSDAVIRGALAEMIWRRNPEWAQSFLVVAAGQSLDPRAVAELFRALRVAKMAIPERASSVLVANLHERGMHAEAWGQYAAAHPGVVRHRSRDPRFAGAQEFPALFDWTPRAEGGLTTSIERDGKTGSFYFSAPQAMGGTAITQRQFLPPGTYKLEGRTADINQPEGSRPYWTLTCASGIELLRLPIPNMAHGEFRGETTVPPSCPAQTLALVVRASDSVDGASGRILSVELRPR